MSGVKLKLLGILSGVLLTASLDEALQESEAKKVEDCVRTLCWRVETLFLLLSAGAVL